MPRTEVNDDFNNSNNHYNKIRVTEDEKQR